MKTLRVLAWTVLLAAGLRAPSLAAAIAPSPWILDPGHGGKDSGAVARGFREKDIALAIALKVKEKLEGLGGIPVLLTRDSDTYLPLDQRVGQSLEWGGRAFVSLHVNKVRRRGPRGITVFAFGRQRAFFRRRHRVAPLPPPPQEQRRESREFAREITSSLRRQGFIVDSPGRAPYYVLKNPRIPSILIELGYLSNPREAELLSDPAYQERLASALALGLSRASVIY